MPDKIVVGGDWRETDHVLDVTFPYDNSVVGSVYLANQQDMDDAVTAAQAGFNQTRQLPTHERTRILEKLHDLMYVHFDEFIQLMILEGGKTRRVAVGEMTRALQTIKISAEEARRIEGNVFSIDWTPTGDNRQGFTKRVPIGIVLGITPFNYPINLACHKIGPAIASGNAIIIKPAEKTPLSSVLLSRLVLEAGYPPQAYSMLNAYGRDTEPLVTDPRIAMLSFTGSAEIGWMLKQKATRKKVILELGGNAGMIVHNDADLKLAVAQAVTGGFTNAGQNCIAVQRIFVQDDVFEDFEEQFVTAVAGLRVGDPRQDTVDIGPLITQQDAERAERWIQSAIAEGATLRYGGKREGQFLDPTVLTDTSAEMRVNCEEIFAPVVTLSSYRTWDEALACINDTQYGLQAGIFTRDMGRIMDAWDRIEVGGLQVNSASTFRVDHMPYGGVKASGFGREGVPYTIEEMTDLRLMVINTG